jgi:hypothetical protein
MTQRVLFRELSIQKMCTVQQNMTTIFNLAAKTMIRQLQGLEAHSLEIKMIDFIL